MWNPFQEKTEQIRFMLDSFKYMLPYIVTLICLIIFCYTIDSMWKSYLYRVHHNIPCEDVQKIIKEIKRKL